MMIIRKFAGALIAGAVLMPVLSFAQGKDVFFVNEDADSPNFRKVSAWPMGNFARDGANIVYDYLAPLNRSCIGVGDFNGDGFTDSVWISPASNQMTVFFQNNGILIGTQILRKVPDDLTVVGIGDADGDGDADFLLEKTGMGVLFLWTMNGANFVSTTRIGKMPTASTVVGYGDLDNDGKADIFMRKRTQPGVDVTFMDGATPTGSATIAVVPLAYNFVGTADYDGDGKKDIMWMRQDKGSDMRLWKMDVNVFQGETRLENAKAKVPKGLGAFRN